MLHGSPRRTRVDHSSDRRPDQKKNKSIFSTFNINSPSPRKFVADDAEEEKNTPDVSVAVAEDSLLKVQDAELLNDRGVASSHGSGTTSHGSKDSVGGGGAAGKTNSHYGGNMLTVSDVPTGAATPPQLLAAPQVRERWMDGLTGQGQETPKTFVVAN